MITLIPNNSFYSPTFSRLPSSSDLSKDAEGKAVKEPFSGATKDSAFFVGSYKDFKKMKNLESMVERCEHRFVKASEHRSVKASEEVNKKHEENIRRECINQLIIEQCFARDFSN